MNRLKAVLSKIARNLLGWPGVTLLILAFLALAFVLLWLIPELLTPSNVNDLQLAELQNELRRTWAQVLLSIVVLGTFVVTWWRASVAEKAVDVSREQQITERFTRAIDQLGSDKIAIRLGGIYGLERIARDSPKDHDHWQVMEVLTAYVRENARWEGERDEHGVPISNESEDHRVSTDIQAILTVLGRRKLDHETPDDALDLSNTNLSGANLERVHLEKANLQSACLKDAKFRSAHFENADFRFANLEKSEAVGTRLTGAMFNHANLKRVFIHTAHLERVSLFKTDMRDTNLSEAGGLTQEQLVSAIIDETTILPDYLKQDSAES